MVHKVKFSTPRGSTHRPDRAVNDVNHGNLTTEHVVTDPRHYRILIPGLYCNYLPTRPIG